MTFQPHLSINVIRSTIRNGGFKTGSELPLVPANLQQSPRINSDLGQPLQEVSNSVTSIKLPQPYFQPKSAIAHQPLISIKTSPNNINITPTIAPVRSTLVPTPRPLPSTSHTCNSALCRTYFAIIKKVISTSLQGSSFPFARSPIPLSSHHWL